MKYHIATGIEQGKSRTKKGIITAITSVVLLTGFALPALAEPSDQGACRQAAGETLETLSSEGNRGDFVSDVIFGNEPNVLVGVGGPEEQVPGSQAGNVVPSQSPGPFVNLGANEPPRNDRGPQGFGGDELAAAINEACN